MSRRPPPSCAGEHNSACRSPPGRRCLLSDVGPKAQRLSNPLDLPLARCTGCIGGILVWRCYLFAAQHIFRSSDLSRSQGSGSRKPKGHDHEHRTQVQQLAQVPRNHHRTASHERSRTSRPRHRPQRHPSRCPDRCRLLIASHRIQKALLRGRFFIAYCRRADWRFLRHRLLLHQLTAHLHGSRMFFALHIVIIHAYKFLIAGPQPG